MRGMKKLIGGGISIFVGAFMLLGFTVSFSEKGGSADIGDVVAIVLFIIAPIALGTGLIRSHLRAKRKALEAREKLAYSKRERQVLRLAQQKGGRLTIPEIAADTSLTTQEAEEFMRRLVTNGYVNMDVTETGVIVYEFYEIAHRGELSE